MNKALSRTCIFLFLLTFFVAAFPLHATAITGDAHSKEDALFKRLDTYNNNVLNQLNHIFFEFCFEEAALSLTHLRTEKNPTDRQNNLRELYFISSNAFLKEYLSKSDKIEVFKSNFAEQNGSYLSQRHIENLWHYHQDFGHFRDIHNSHEKNILSKNFAESYLILIDKLINAMVYPNDLPDLIHQSDFLKDIVQRYPDLQNKLPQIASAKEWGKDPKFNFNKTRLGAPIETNLKHVLNTVKDGIIHYSYLEPKELDDFHNKLMKKQKKLPANFDVSDLKYEHNGIILSLGAFRLLYGQGYLGAHTKSTLKAFNELINLNKKLELKAFLQYSDQQPVNILLCRTIGIDSYFTIRERILEEYSSQRDFYEIYNRFAGRHKTIDQPAIAIFKPGIHNRTHLPQSNKSQGPTHIVPEQKSSEVVPSQHPDEPSSSALCDEPKTKKQCTTASCVETIAAFLNFEKFFSKEQQPSWGDWAEEFQGNLDGFKKLRIKEWKDSARAAFDMMDNQDPSRPNLLLVVKELTSLLGFKDHPYLDNNKSCSPMLKIYLKTWRDESLSAFMKGIVHLDKKSQKKAKAEFVEIGRLYNALLSNIRDYRVYYNALKRHHKLEKIDENYTHHDLMKKNKEFFHQMQVSAIANMSPFYPLNRDILIDYIANNSSNAGENSLYLTKLLFTAPEIFSYLDEVKTGLNKLNDTYWNAQIHVHSQHSEAKSLNELIELRTN